MRSRLKSKLRIEITVRAAADALMLSASLCGTLFLLSFGGKLDRLIVKSLVGLDVLLLVIALPLLYVVGMYTRARTYRMRYKALCVAEAVTAAFVGLLIIHRVLPYPLLPFKAMAVAWMCSLALLVGARLWSKIWIYVLVKEERLPAKLAKQQRARNVLLIGGAGYIGSAVLPKLLERGYRVRLLDSFVYGKEPIARFLGHPNLQMIQADFRQVDKVVESMQDIGAVIHLGAIVGDPACALNEELTIEVNLIATRMIAEVAKGQGVSRFIFASTCSVYGASDLVLDERSALNPVSLYARSKIACEKVLLELHDNRFQPVILRFGTVYGLSGRTRFDLVVNLLSAKAVIDREITIFGSDQWRPFLHVEDAARAVLMALEAPAIRLQHTIFNVGSDEQNRTLGQVGELIHQIVPTARLKCTDDDSVDRRNYRVNFSRIRELLGFRPQWEIEGGVLQVLEAVRSGKVINYRDARYSNVKFLSEEDGRRKLPVQNGWAKDMVQAWEPSLSNQPMASA